MTRPWIRARAEGAGEPAGRLRRGSAPRRSPWRASRRSASTTSLPVSKPESTPDAVAVAAVELASRRDLERRQPAALRLLVVRPGPRRRAAPRSRARAALGALERRAARPRRRASCSSTRSTPCTASVTGCSTWSRVFISRKKNRSRRRVVEELDGAGADVADRLGRGRAAASCSARADVVGEVRARAPPRRPSGAGAGSSSPARRGPATCRAVSPTTWTSTCRPRSTYGSTKTVPSPNADAASAARLRRPRRRRSASVADDAHAAAAAAGGRLHQQRQVGLGRGRRRRARRAPGRRPRAISFLASIFEPIASIDSGVGPTQVSPASITARAKSAFSERKP